MVTVPFIFLQTCLFDILLEQFECETLMKLHFLGRPFLLETSMSSQYLMNHIQYMLGSGRVVGGWVCRTDHATHLVYLLFFRITK